MILQGASSFVMTRPTVFPHPFVRMSRSKRPLGCYIGPFQAQKEMWMGCIYHFITNKLPFYTCYIRRLLEAHDILIQLYKLSIPMKPCRNRTKQNSNVIGPLADPHEVRVQTCRYQDPGMWPAEGLLKRLMRSWTFDVPSLDSLPRMFCKGRWLDSKKYAMEPCNLRCYTCTYMYYVRYFKIVGCMQIYDIYFYIC